MNGALRSWLFVLLMFLPSFCLLFAGILVFAVGAADAADRPAGRPLVFIFTGESNSGGLGSNAAAEPAERAPRPCVRIMNLTDGRFGFEDLKLGVNNLRDHFRLDGDYATSHGFENQLANAVEAGAFPGHERVHLVKTGQGGSIIAEWDPKHASGYWRKFIERIAAAKRQLPANTQWVVWFSLGINDAIAHTPIVRWKQDTLAHLRRIKEELPGAVIVMTQFQSMKKYGAFDAAIAEIAANEPGVLTVDSSGAVLGDENHWNYAGLKTVTQRLVETTAKVLEKKPAR